MAEHVDEIWIPPGQDPVDQRVIRAKEQTYVQVKNGVIKRPISAEEYYSRQAYDNLEERRGTTTVAEGSEPIEFGTMIKMIQIFVPSTSLSALFVNFMGNRAVGDLAQNVQILPGEGREFWIPVERIHISSDGAATATWRITFGY